AGQGDYRDLGRPPADVDHHVAGGGLHRQADADRGGHRFGDHHDLLGSRGLRRIAHGAPFHFGDPRGNAHDHFGLYAKNVLVDDGLEEVPQHLLGDVEVGDDAVLERPHGEDAVGGAAEHPFGLETDAFDLAGRALDRDHRGLVEDDALAFDV